MTTDFYEIERTTREIVKGGYKRVALQFPDELLKDSVRVYRALNRALKQDDSGSGSVGLYVLADTSYGSCCVDEIAAQHADADLIVHYGHACMSRTARLPVVYVFGRTDPPVDVWECATRVVDAVGARGGGLGEVGKVLVRCEVGYLYQADEIVKKLRERFDGSGSGVEVVHTTATTPELQVGGNAGEGRTIVYIGGESLALANLLMTNASSAVYAYDPATRTAQLASGRTNRLLMRRYAAVQKARDADVFGILVGTLGVDSYLPLITHIRAVLTRARKKCYTISVGKLNPAKLANFLEVECFVLVACPENSVIDSKEFLRPIVTPYELEVALRVEQSWTGRYVLDFEELLRGADGENGDKEEHDDDDADADGPVFSLTSGRYRHPKQYGDAKNRDERERDGADHPSAPSSNSNGAIALRNQDNTLAKLSEISAAGQFLQSRSYKGLEARVGADPPSVLEQGRSGIAREYQSDTPDRRNAK